MTKNAAPQYERAKVDSRCYFDENETRNQIKNTFEIIMSINKLVCSVYFNFDGSRVSIAYSPFVTLHAIMVEMHQCSSLLKHYNKNVIQITRIPIKNAFQKFNLFSIFVAISNMLDRNLNARICLLICYCTCV